MGPQETETRESEHGMVTLFKSYMDLPNPPILELQDINRRVVGALYLNDLRYKKLAISETNSSEKYFLVADGVGIYFSFFRKLDYNHHPVL